MNSQVVLEPSDEGGYTAFVPALPGCISEGDNKDEAIKNGYQRKFEVLFQFDDWYVLR